MTRIFAYLIIVALDVCQGLVELHPAGFCPKINRDKLKVSIVQTGLIVELDAPVVAKTPLALAAGVVDKHLAVGCCIFTVEHLRVVGLRTCGSPCLLVDEDAVLLDTGTIQIR